MNDETASDPAARRAKVVLWLAVGVFVGSQCLRGVAQDALDLRRGWWFLWMKEMLPFIVSDYSDGYGVNRIFAIFGVLLLTFLLSLLVSPWVVDFLSKARPMLWIGRVVITGAAGVIARHLISTEFIGKGFSWSPLLTTGLFWSFVAIVLNVVGLWMIPKARKVQSLTAQEIPTTGEHE